jgi:2,4-dienoyl-CoA reductase-like NADH-dependent reductase (Old Yellow Enzyme family)
MFIFDIVMKVPFAEAIKREYPNLTVGAVGLITDPKDAEAHLEKGQADVIFLARELLRNPHWPLYAAQELGVAIKPANQYERAWMTVLTPKPLSS